MTREARRIHLLMGLGAGRESNSEIADTQALGSTRSKESWGRIVRARRWV